MQVFNINSKNIKTVVYRDWSLEVELTNNDRWLYQMIDANTVNAFLNSNDKDKFYDENIVSNRNFRRRMVFMGSRES